MGEVAKPSNVFASILMLFLDKITKKLPTSGLLGQAVKKIKSILSKQINKLAKKLRRLLNKKISPFFKGKLVRVVQVVLDSKIAKQLVRDIKATGGKNIFKGQKLIYNLQWLTAAQLMVEMMGCKGVGTVRNICQSFKGFVIPNKKTVLRIHQPWTKKKHGGPCIEGKDCTHGMRWGTLKVGNKVHDAITFKFQQCDGTNNWKRDQNPTLTEMYESKEVGRRTSKGSFFGYCGYKVKAACEAVGTWVYKGCNTCCCKNGGMYWHRTSFILTRKAPGAEDCETWYQAVEAFFSAATSTGAKIGSLMSMTGYGCHMKSAKKCCSDPIAPPEYAKPKQ